ncbi:EAL domain-containing protein [Lichenihabitans sp. PAMC28606]|uniref:putative bifunctional diguanylate cyclase/phosphodiesterase n=1 Tax=Lichenihabitans sp. PAMC28606 TaxID=2880932 RepID=UPI001D09FE40|nr:EAL domain-containing protein [Lichenihabitans sp. PAMC28606]UDL96208.1 EAL domain-containing protein [Lichenihabitans sp. PAMC28606]
MADSDAQPAFGSSSEITRLLEATAHVAGCPIAIYAQRSPSGFRLTVHPGLDRHDVELLALIEEAAENLSNIFIVDDLHADIDRDPACLEDPAVRFFAAIRLLDRQGECLGVLAIADERPHAGLSPAQSYALATLSAHLLSLVQLRRPDQRVAPERATRERWSTSERLRLLESVVVHANDAVLITEASPIDRPGPRIVYCNAAFERTTGYSEAEVLGLTPRILQSDQTDRASLDRLRLALHQWKPVEVELLNTRKDGTVFWVELSIVPVADEAGWFTHWISVQRDVTDRKRAEEIAVRARLTEAENEAFEKEILSRKNAEKKLRFDAFHDDLTKLRNRAFFMDRLTTVLGRKTNPRSTYCTVLFLDLNGFKLVNDSLGHRAGDVLLIETALRLRSCIRPGDTLSRIGGDEFAILIEDTIDATSGISVAQRVLNALSRPVKIGHQDVFSSASIGIAQSSELFLHAEELLRNADIAMYTAKRGGTAGYALFTRSMHVAAVAALEMQTDLRQAIGRDEFVLLFQPIVDPASARITGMEALVRWQHPERGLIGPAQFIPLAEEIGVIRDLTRWVLRGACAQMKALDARHAGRMLRLSVNVSGNELLEKEFIPEIQQLLDETGLEAHRLQLEITESVFISRPAAVGQVLENLRSLGIRIALDDFGTGFSSLSYLDRYPIDTIKIDQSFIVRMLARERTLAIVETIIDLGKTLKLDVVAEGVENEEQLGRLLELGCSSVQGFLFAPAMSGSAIDALLMAAP